MKYRIDIRGILIPNDYKLYYDYFKEDSTCPADVQKVMDMIQPEDEIEVYINSPGGVIDVGSEIYTMLRSKKEQIKIYITGEACSAASIVAMAAYCEMAPTALMMVHCVSTGARGNHRVLEDTVEMLRTADLALSTAYSVKSGMSKEEVLDMMEKETWMTAEQARKRNLIDAVMFEEKVEQVPFVAGPLFKLPDQEQVEKVKNMLKQADAENGNADLLFLLQTKLNFQKLRGENE